MHNLSLQPRSKLLYSTLPNHIALSNAEKHWDPSETRIAKTWVAAGCRFFTNTFPRTFADLLGDPWGCKPHPEHEHSLVGDGEEGCQWWFEIHCPVNDRLHSHKLALNYHKTSSPRNLKKSTTYFICYGHLSSPKLLNIHISNELFYFVLHAQFIPTATKQVVIFSPTQPHCFEQCREALGLFRN